MPFINNTHKFIFIGNARCGSTTMYTKLGSIFADDDIVWENGRDAKPWLYHMSIKDTVDRYPFAKEYKKFCFVRNPWSRFLSAYREFIKPLHHEWSSSILKYKTFDDFCSGFTNDSISNDIHFKPLYNQMTINGQRCIDYVGRFENMNEDFTKILYEITGNNYTLDIHLNHTASSDYAIHYCNKSREMIEDFYSADILLLDYRF